MKFSDQELLSALNKPDDFPNLVGNLFILDEEEGEWTPLEICLENEILEQDKSFLISQETSNIDSDALKNIMYLDSDENLIEAFVMGLNAGEGEWAVDDIFSEKGKTEITQIIYQAVLHAVNLEPELLSKNPKTEHFIAKSRVVINKNGIWKFN